MGSIFKNILIGLVLAGCTIAIHMRLDSEKGFELTSILMVLIGSVYYGFALVSSHKKAKIIEIVVASIFVIIGILGLWVSPWMLIFGLFLHGFWDIAHHNDQLKLVNIPEWYVPFCATYDWTMGIYLLLIIVLN